MAVMTVSSATANSDYTLPGVLDHKYNDYVTWLKSLKPKSDNYSPSIKNLHDLIESDPGIKIMVNRMISEVPQKYRAADSVKEWLDIMNGILTQAPKYNAPSHFPMSALFVHMMYTPSGSYILTNTQLNQALKAILEEWQVLLDSKASVGVLNKKMGG
jgi:hypothetical protein